MREAKEVRGEQAVVPTTSLTTTSLSIALADCCSQKMEQGLWNSLYNSLLVKDYGTACIAANQSRIMEQLV